MRQMGYETFARVLSIKSVMPSAQVAERLQLPNARGSPSCSVCAS